jgi:hypothetical protein
MTLAMASLLLGCHPQAAVPAMPGALAGDVVATAIAGRVDELSACLVDTDVVPGQRSAAQSVAVQLSIADSGRVQSVTIDKLDDADANECIVRKTSAWMFPRGGLTTARVELRIQAKSAELAAVRILPATRTSAR